MRSITRPDRQSNRHTRSGGRIEFIRHIRDKKHICRAGPQLSYDPGIAVRIFFRAYMGIEKCFI